MAGSPGRIIASTALVLAVALASVAAAPPPRLYHYQGKLVTSTGAILPGPVGLRLRLYDSPTAMAPVLFDESHSGVPLHRGLFSVLIGSQTPGGLSDAALAPAEVYLGVSVDGGAELTPRIRIASAPYASKSTYAEQLVRPGSIEAGIVLDAAGKVGVGTTTPDPSAALDVTSSTGGMLLPRMTTAQRNAIASPATGLQVFNIDSGCVDFYIGGLWQSLICGCTAPPASPLSIAGPDVVCENQSNVIYSITPIFGATAYDWTVPPDAAIIAGNGTPSITVNFGVVPGSIIVASRNACGSSVDRVLPISYRPDPEFTFAPSLIYQGSAVTFTPALSGATYSWTFQNGTPSTSTAESPTVSWEALGTQDVLLTVTDDGCSRTSMQTVNVSPALASCAAILAADSGAVSGAYGIDPDGAGGQPAFNAYCDMTTDGGGWTIVIAHAAASGQPGMTSNSEAAGNALNYETFNLSLTKKELVSAISTQSLIRRSAGPWLRINRALFDDNLVGSGNQHPHYSVTITADNGASASNCQMGYSNFNISGGGGDFGITTSGGSFDHHSPNYYHLNSSCSNMHFYQHGTTYNVNTGLGSWAVTASCDSDNPVIGGWYAAMR